MTVNAQYIPAKRTEFLVNIAKRAHVGYVTINLQVVEVHNGNEVIQLLVSSKHACLPVRALLQLAVAQKDKYLLGALTACKSVHRKSQSTSRRYRETLAKRARANLNTRTCVAIWVTLQSATKLTEGNHILVMEPIKQVVRSIQHRSHVTLGQEEPILGVVLWVVVVVLHNSREEQCSHNVCRTERAAGMT